MTKMLLTLFGNKTSHVAQIEVLDTKQSAEYNPLSELLLCHCAAVIIISAPQ